MNLIPVPKPPEKVKRFWRSDFGQKAIHVLEPSKWWTILFFSAVIIIVVWTLTIYRTQAKDEAAHSAEIVSNADGQYRACLQSIPVLTKINGFITGDRIIRNALVANSRAVVAATNRSDPQYETRVTNLRRLLKARASAYLVEFPVPTKAICLARRAEVFTDAGERVPPLS